MIRIQLTSTAKEWSKASPGQRTEFIERTRDGLHDSGLKIPTVAKFREAMNKRMARQSVEEVGQAFFHILVLGQNGARTSRA